MTFNNTKNLSQSGLELSIQKLLYLLYLVLSSSKPHIQVPGNLLRRPSQPRSHCLAVWALRSSSPPYSTLGLARAGASELRSSRDLETFSASALSPDGELHSWESGKTRNPAIPSGWQFPQKTMVRRSVVNSTSMSA